MFTLSFSWGKRRSKSARALIDAARNEADEKLSAELSRLEALRAVNPNIRDDELTAIEATVSR